MRNTGRFRAALTRRAESRHPILFVGDGAPDREQIEDFDEAHPR